MRVDDQELTLVTKYGSLLQWPVGSQRPISRNWVTGRAVVDRTTIHVPDLQAAENEFPQGATYAKEYGHRTTLATPLLREGVPIGAILIRRMDVRPFSDRQIKLLETFADQAVIAIENTRLFEAEQASKRELKNRSNIRRRRATCSRSSPPRRPTCSRCFRHWSQSACRLCEAYDGIILLREGDWFVRSRHTTADSRQPCRAGKSPAIWVNGRCVADGVQIHLRDLQAETDRVSRGCRTRATVGRSHDPCGSADAGRGSHRSDHDPTRRSTPVLRQADRACRDLRRPSRHRHREHAAVRGGAGEQARADENRWSIRPRPAKCLSVISRSPTDAQPVFDTIAAEARRGSARRKFGIVFRFDGRDCSSSSRITGATAEVVDDHAARVTRCRRAERPARLGAVLDAQCRTDPTDVERRSQHAGCDRAIGGYRDVLVACRC